MLEVTKELVTMSSVSKLESKRQTHPITTPCKRNKSLLVDSGAINH